MQVLITSCKKNYLKSYVCYRVIENVINTSHRTHTSGLLSGARTMTTLSFMSSMEHISTWSKSQTIRYHYRIAKKFDVNIMAAKNNKEYSHIIFCPLDSSNNFIRMLTMQYLITCQVVI